MGDGDARPFIIVSGLPASGKTTLARSLAHGLDLPLIDKDDFLERLFDTEGAGDTDWRHRLSRQSDQMFRVAAERSSGAVLTSFWRHPSASDDSGTPSDWVAGLSPSMVEVYCDCPPAEAAARFRARVRHPGHNDRRRSPEELLNQFEAIDAHGPLGLGQLVRVNTSAPYDPSDVLRRARALLRT